MEVLLAKPRGFCAGVERAIEIVERALERFGAPIYVRHEVVHNTFVVEDLRSKGAVFIEELDEVPAGATVIFSAHGVLRRCGRKPRRGAAGFRRDLPAGHQGAHEVRRQRDAGREIVMIGHRGHREVEGTMGQVEDGIYLVEKVADVAGLQVKSPEKLAYVTQTTLSMDDAAQVVAALKERFSGIVGPKKDDICYATQNRQDAVKFMAPQCDIVIVVGSPNSFNSNRLREVATNLRVPAYLVDSAEQIDPKWLEGKRRIGVTAGASAPEVLVESVIESLQRTGPATVRVLEGVTESVSFPLPRPLSDD